MYRDPLYAMGIAFMLFMRTTMTHDNSDYQLTLKSVEMTICIANKQIKKAKYKDRKKLWVPSITATSSHFKQSILPPTLPIAKMDGSTWKASFIPNSILRASVVRAECSLILAILQMTQYNNFFGIQCISYLKKAYSDYSFVWQQYKRMGQEYTRYIDRETVSAVHLGLGTLHLIFSCLPRKQARTVLAYFIFMSTQVPRLCTIDLMKTAVDCLASAQKAYPNSCFFLLYLTRVSRIVRNIALSDQFIQSAINQAQHEWMETAVLNICQFEMGQNFALQLDWESAATCFERLRSDRGFNSPSSIIARYFEGTCYGMMEEHTRSILAFAEVHKFLQHNQFEASCASSINEFIKQRIDFFQRNGYQNLEFCLPALEMLLVWNVFDQMGKDELNSCLSKIEKVLSKIHERERVDYTIRLHQLMPSTNLPNYYEHRAVAMLIKASILNSAERYEESIASINWIMDNKHQLATENWILPVTYWGKNNY
ncbi:hypothetical protein BDF20DRAFT_816280 [Mycotypha africana]|uniref:uncharacterized protein n=1 Tax=Mycotypha africana TaxID=64632 RepID=UPI002301278D|nr:uncharacterized protein BDF20DRAFT_816280 [Mycotypha africana]KAI8984245.1 hypothetical protein BDF20DRAFT_816280 [Mycotypha africana]